MSSKSRRDFLVTAGIAIPSALSLSRTSSSAPPDHGSAENDGDPARGSAPCVSAQLPASWSIQLSPDGRYVELSYNGLPRISGLKISVNSSGRDFSSDEPGNRLRIEDSGKNWIVSVAAATPWTFLIGRAGPSIVVSLDDRNGEGRTTVTALVHAGSDPVHARLDGVEDGVLQMKSGPALSTRNNAVFDRFRDEAIKVLARETTFSSSGAEIRVSASGTLNAAPFCRFEIVDNVFSRRLPFYRPLDKALWPQAPVGWCSWYYYFVRVTEQDILANATAVAKDFKKFGLEYCLIDSGWQLDGDGESGNPIGGSWSTPNSKFPHGMKWIAGEIQGLGLKPGLWLSAFGNSDPAFYENHKTWFLHDSDGNPNVGSWFGKYVADFSNPDLQQHLREVYRQHTTEWGYDYFKLDGENDTRDIWAAHRTRAYDPTLEPNDAFRSALQQIRKGMEARPHIFFSACGPVYPTQSAGIAQAARLGGDVVADGEPPSFRGVRTMLDAVRRGYFTHNIMWYGDPDVLVVRPPLPLHEARTWTSALGLTGQLVMLSDNMGALPEERKELLRKILPPSDITPMDLYPLAGDAECWVLHVQRSFGSWAVAGLFNWDSDGQEMLDSDLARAASVLSHNDALLGSHHSWEETMAICSRIEKVVALNQSYEAISNKPPGLELIPVPISLVPPPPRKLTLDFAKAGFENGRPYLLFDFWEQKFLGKVSNSYSINLPSHASAVISLRPDLDRPQVIGTDRHVTMGGVELLDESWNAGKKMLSLHIQTVDNYTSVFTVHAGTHRLTKALTSDAIIGTTSESGLVTLRVTSHTGGEKHIDIQFD